jgi:hypothetical protein
MVYEYKQFYTTMPSDSGPDLVQNDPPFVALQFTEDEVQSVLLELDVSKGAGPDGKTPLILKNCASAFACSLSVLFNRSLSTWVFPGRWKFSYMTPIFKESSQTIMFCLVCQQNISVIFDYVCLLFYADDMMLFLSVRVFRTV